MRKIRRRIARYRMKKAGIQKINMKPLVRKPDGMIVRERSFFARNWREYSIA